MSRRLVVSALTAALTVPSAPLFAAPAAQVATGGTVSGTADTAAGQAMPNVTVRLRNMQTGLAGQTTSNAAGQFSFTALNPGTYVVEVVNAAGDVVGTSAAISLTAGAMTVTGLTVTASALTAAAAAGAGGGAFLLSTWGIVLVAAVGAGVAGIVVAENKPNTSPSQ